MVQFKPIGIQFIVIINQWNPINSFKNNPIHSLLFHVDCGGEPSHYLHGCIMIHEKILAEQSLNMNKIR